MLGNYVFLPGYEGVQMAYDKMNEHFTKLQSKASHTRFEY